MITVEQHRPSSGGTGNLAPGWIERARPLLGTLVRISVCGLEASAANAAIDRGFEAIETIHSLMSFHEPASDVSRLNREAGERLVPVDMRTAEVLQLSLEVAAASDGIFDVTVAPLLVESQFLPAPGAAPRPDPQANWRDVEIEAGGVRFRRPLWVDLGGIAKGFAVDAAFDAMRLPRDALACVDAGGDLRVSGPLPRHVILDAPDQRGDALPSVEITDGAVASSRVFVSRQSHHGRWPGPHVRGNDRGAAPLQRFASVVASRCAVADALTKVALFASTDGVNPPAFAHFEATAHVYGRETGWHTLGRAV